MSTAHAINGRPGPSHRACPAGPDTVKTALTPDRRGRAVENDEFAAFARRVLRACARRVADGDVEALTLMLGLSAEIDPLARGVAWLLSETGVPRRIKTAWLDDATIGYLAAYAATLRGTTGRAA